MANTSKAQVKTIDKVFITLHKKSYSLAQFFKETEKQTEFRFFYTDKALNKSQGIDLTKHQGNVEEFLIEIAKQTDLRFRQVNNAISVIMAPKETEQDLVQIDLNPENVDVQGTVTDEGGEPIPGVTVSVAGTTIGTATDLDGKYTLSVPEGSTLMFSFIGFVTQNIAVGDQSVIDITLIEDMASLDEVVVVGYGTQKKRDLTGSISVLDVKEGMKVESAISPLQGIQGRLAGVDVSSSNGAPGAGIVIRIRGVGTINDNSPLLVVDGMLTGGSLNGINPSDVESIQVLKDASAAAIYGSRAANGVIIVTTKQGKAGTTKFNLNSSFGFARPTNLYPLVNNEQYAMLNNRARIARDRQTLSPNVPVSEGGSFDPAINTDWQREVYGGNSPIKRIDFSASGGGEKSTYYVSFGHVAQDGVLINTDFEQYIAKINTSFKKGILTVGENFNLAHSQRKNASSGFRDVFVETIRMPPTVPVFNPDNLGGFGGAGNQYDVVVANPVAHQLLKENTSDGLDLLGTVFAELQFIPELKYRVNLGIEGGYNHNKFYVPEYFMSNQDNTDVNSLSEGRGTNFSWLLEHTLDYNTIIRDHHNIGLLVGASAQSFRSSNIGGGVQDIPGSLRVIGAGRVINNLNGGINENSLQSLFGRTSYNFKGKYLATFNLRYDGTSRFPEQNRWGLFPSASAAWRISEEPFFQPLLPVVNDLKLRVSYGQLGNQSIGNYQYSSLLNLNMGYPFGSPADPGISDPGQITPGFSISNYNNPDIKWESTTTKDIGLDINLFNNKFSITADYWVRTTTDMLTGIPIPPSVGVSNRPIFNVGSVENSGLEFTANYFKRQGDLNFEVSANFSTLKNRVLSLTGNEDQAGIPGGFIESSIYNVTSTRVGTEIGAFYAYQVLGIYQNQSEIDDYNLGGRGNPSPGDLIYDDINGDGVLNQEDLVHMGSGIPKFQGGINFALSYKNFDLSLFWQGVAGNKIYDALKYWTEGSIGNFNYSQRMLNAWTEENRDTDIPRLVLGDPGRNTLASDRWLEDGSYLRLKNFQLGYALPKSFMNRISPDSGIRFYVSGFNLLTFSGYTGYDPEIISDGKLSRGVDRGRYPMSKTFVAGLQFNF